MKKIMLALAVAFVAGCTSPTSGVPGLDEAQPNLDSGFLGGSGNGAGGSVAPNAVTTDSAQTGRAGFLGGSGN